MYMHVVHEFTLCCVCFLVQGLLGPVGPRLFTIHVPLSPESRKTYYFTCIVSGYLNKDWIGTGLGLEWAIYSIVYSW